MNYSPIKAIRKRSSKTGLPPGTLVHIGEETRSEIQINVLEYNEFEVNEKTVSRFEDCPDLASGNMQVWINVIGVHDIEAVRQLEKKYSLHTLVLEDIVNTIQRPKVEDYGNYLYIVLKSLFFDSENTIKTEQISLILMPGLVISFQEGLHSDLFHMIRERIHSARGLIRKQGADYLAYSLMDNIVDGYFGIMEIMGEKLEEIEDEVESNPGKDTIGRIHRIKRDLVYFRRVVWPLREVPLFMDRNVSKTINESTKIYLRDIYDHIVQLIDMNDSYRDMSTGIFDLYLSIVSFKLNEVMKLLTVIGTIFIPLTFLTGVYGMNFQYMPELDWKFGYFALIGGMFLLAGAMILYFKRKKWL